MLPKYTLKLEAQSQSCPFRGLVQRITLPLVSPIAKLVKYILCHQVHDFSCFTAFLQRGCKKDVANFQNKVLWYNSHKTCKSCCLTCRNRHNSKEDSILSSLLFLNKLAEVILRLERSIKHPLPKMIVTSQFIPQTFRMSCCVKWFQGNILTAQSNAGWLYLLMEISDIETLFLISLRIKVFGAQPSFNNMLPCGPILADHSVPDNVTDNPLNYQVFTEGALKAKPKSQGSISRWLVYNHCSPFISSIAELVKDVASHQIHGFCGLSTALQGRAKHDVADFYGSVRRSYCYETCVPGRYSC